MKELILLSPATPGAVRTVKFADYFKSKNYELSFWGWCRSRKEEPKVKEGVYKEVNYVLHGGGSGTKILPLLYVVFIIKLFFKLLFERRVEEKVFMATNYETAYATWMASKFRRIVYFYDIWDELAISHNFPPVIMKYVRRIDGKIRRDSNFYIHVDENRVSEIDSSNYIVLYNTPYDYFKGESRNVNYEKSFAVTGYLQDGRGMYSILSFAKKHLDYKFIVVGEFINQKTRDLFLQQENVEYHHFMPQNELFDIIGNCRGIFSLYDTSIPIYRLAASNKLYDAMMLSIPVIVNKEVLASKFVQEHQFGYVVDYEPNDTWDCLVQDPDAEVLRLGQNGRRVYLDKYEFVTLMDKVLEPKLSALMK